MTEKSLSQLYAEHEGKVSDKWTLYLREYDRLLSAYRSKSVRLLEIGIQNGGSLEIWRKFFKNSQILLGCDINVDCGKLVYTDPVISVVIGDANSDVVEKKISDISPKFDIVIDDGSHRSSDIVKSFARYFPKIDSGGIFIAEDLHCSYWSEFEGGLYDPYSSIAFFKRLADIVNHEHWGIAAARVDIISGFQKEFDCHFDLISLSEISSIEFLNSICVVRKSNSIDCLLGDRFIAGIEASVVAEKYFFDKETIRSDEKNNRFAIDVNAVEDTIFRMQRSLQFEIEKNKVLCEKNEQLEAKVHNIREKNEQLEASVRSITASYSWKITSPLRRLSPKILEAYQTGVKSVQLGGGVGNTVQLGAKVLREEGISGIKWRLRNAHKLMHPEKSLIHAGDIERAEDTNKNYEKWIRRYDTLDEIACQAMRQSIIQFSYRPKISVLMPVYDPPLNLLKEAIESVKKQIYTEWELCIADDASKNQDVRDLLRKYSEEDQRIKIVFREKNGHISAASNSALALASGDFIALLDNDDVLPPHALFWVADAINKNPNVVLIYSDEDKLNDQGNRFDPHFKCEFNYELFLAQNMISHLGVYRLDVVNEVKGFRLDFEGSQDYDLALRVIEKISKEQIIHIPRILYHWRAIAGSTALSSGEKNYPAEAGRRAVSEHLQRTGQKGDVLAAPGVPTLNRIQYTLPDKLPLVSIVIPTRDRVDLLKICIESIFGKTNYDNYEIIIIDNDSKESATIDYFNGLPVDKVKVIRDCSVFNYSALNNFGVSMSRGEVICFMNNDIEIITSDWLGEMVSWAVQKEIGCVGARLWYPDGKLQHGGVILGLGGVAGYSHKNIRKRDYGYFGRGVLHQSFSAATAACLVVRRQVFDEVNGLNEDLAVAFNDVDFCLKVRASGYRNIWTPYAEMVHHESASRGLDISPEKTQRFNSEVEYMKNKWGNTLLVDPAYSPNLTIHQEDFSLAWPPRVELLS